MASADPQEKRSRFPRGTGEDKLAEVGMAMLFLTSHRDDFGKRAWKGLDWDLLELLHEKGWISNPKSKAKSVALTDEGERLAKAFFEKHFVE